MPISTTKYQAHLHTVPLHYGSASNFLQRWVSYGCWQDATIKCSHQYYYYSVIKSFNASTLLLESQEQHLVNRTHVAYPERFVFLRENGQTLEKVIKMREKSHNSTDTVHCYDTYCVNIRIFVGTTSFSDRKDIWVQSVSIIPKRVQQRGSQWKTHHVNTALQ